MPRPQFQDIVPPERRSIKKIPIPERRRPEPVIRVPQERVTAEPVSPLRRQFREPEQEEIRPQYPAPRFTTPEPKHKSKKGWLVVLIFCIIAIGLFAAFALYPRVSGAIITVTPKQQPTTVDAELKAVKEGDGDLHFQTMTLSKDGKLTVPATGDETAEVKATGTIVIYNKYSSGPQKLVANTRFQTADGKIFRIAQPVTIPGYTKTSTTTIPGSVEAKVTADVAGTEYNVGLTDFTIPGFKGDPRFESVYARSKTAIADGFKGVRKKVDPAQATTARQKIQAELKTALISEASKNIPNGFVLPNEAYSIEFTSLPDTSNVAGNAELTERATLHGFIFKRAELAMELAKKGGVSLEGVGDISGVDTLIFSMKKATSTPDWNVSNLTFSLKGSVGLVSAVNSDTLKKELAGKPRKSLNAILANYPGVAKAEVVMRPFWQKNFPIDPNEISITVANGLTK